MKKQTLAFFEKAAGSGVRGLFAVAAAADNAPNFGAMTDKQFQDHFNQALAPSDYPFHGEWTALFDSEMKARVRSAYSSLSSSKKDILTRHLKDDPEDIIFAINTADPSVQGYMEFIHGMTDSEFYDYLKSKPQHFDPRKTSSDSEPLKQQTSSDSEPWSMDIQVGDERIVKKGQGQSGTTVLDTQRGIDNTKPQPVPGDSYTAGVDYKKPAAKSPGSARGEVTKTDMATVRSGSGRRARTTKKSDTGLDKTLNNIKNFFGDNVTPPAAEYATNIAQSILQNKPIVVKQSDVPQGDIDKLLNNLDVNRIDRINDAPIPYADDNIYIDNNGKVRSNIGPNGEKAYYKTNQTGQVGPVPGGQLSLGYTNPLAAAGLSSSTLLADLA